MRRAHYLKQLTTNRYPRHCIWFDTETEPVAIDDNTEIDRLVFGWACYRRRSRGDKWSRPEWYRFTTVEQFWLWVTEHVDKKESLTLFAHNLSYDLPVVDAFNYLYEHEWQLTSAVIESPPVICKWRHDGRTIQAIDTLNYWRTSLATLGVSIGLPKLVMPTEWTDTETDDAYCRRDVEIIMHAVINWFDFIRTHELGGFAPTLASQAMRAYRHRFMHEKILCDEDVVALELARESYHGGRVECHYIGELDGPLYQLDVNSMYPFVMQQSPMPTELIGVYKRLKHLELGKLLREWAVIAEVELATESPVYGVMQEGRLIFPTGEFTTCLTTPELAYALANGHIIRINHAAVYKQAVIFKDYIDYFYNLRLEAKAEGDATQAFFFKILMNSLYGKFGQRGRIYETVDQLDDNSIRAWAEYDYDTGEYCKYRQFAGQLQQLTEEPEARDSHPAIAAHVTAYARMLLWQIMQEAGEGNVFYNDTDCVLVNQDGYALLSHRIDDNTLGYLKLEHTIHKAIIHGPKDYTFDTITRTKGVRANALWLGPNEVEQDQWVGLKGLLQAGDLSAPIRRRVTKQLVRTYTKGTVQPEGNVLPYQLANS